MKKTLFLLCFSSIIAIVASKMTLLPLTHSLSKNNFTSLDHLLKSTSAPSAARFQNHHRKQISLPLSPGSDYTLDFSLGSPNSTTISLYLDTGSDLVWLPCAPFECILCEGKPAISPPLNLSSSSAAPVHCKSKTCSAAHSFQSNSDLCAVARCPIDEIETSDCRKFNCPPFYYAYGDGSLIARLFRDSLILPNSLTINEFTFGCAHSTLAEPIGVAGFGRGALSFPTQLAAVSPHLGNRFSYCLIAHSFNLEKTQNPSPLILGRVEPDKNEPVEFVYTRMLENPKHPYFYSVGLKGISVGSKKIQAPAMLKRIDSKGGGGMVVDSGTTFTMLPANFYNAVVSEFDNRVGRFYKRATQVEENTGLGPCYYYGKMINVPAFSLHFSENGSSVVLPRRNYFYEFLDGSDVKEKKNAGCLMLMNGGDEKEMSGGPWAILGNYQQQDFEVVYDLVKKKVGFARRQCSTLWESLKQN